MPETATAPPVEQSAPPPAEAPKPAEQQAESGLGEMLKKAAQANKDPKNSDRAERSFSKASRDRQNPNSKSYDPRATYMSEVMRGALPPGTADELVYNATRGMMANLNTLGVDYSGSDFDVMGVARVYAESAIPKPEPPPRDRATETIGQSLTQDTKTAKGAIESSGLTGAVRALGQEVKTAIGNLHKSEPGAIDKLSNAAPLPPREQPVSSQPDTAAQPATESASLPSRPDFKMKTVEELSDVTRVLNRDTYVPTESSVVPSSKDPRQKILDNLSHLDQPTPAPTSADYAGLGRNYPSAETQTQPGVASAEASATSEPTASTLPEDEGLATETPPPLTDADAPSDGEADVLIDDDRTEDAMMGMDDDDPNFRPLHAEQPIPLAAPEFGGSIPIRLRTEPALTNDTLDASTDGAWHYADEDTPAESTPRPLETSAPWLEAPTGTMPGLRVEQPVPHPLDSSSDTNVLPWLRPDTESGAALDGQNPQQAESPISSSEQISLAESQIIEGDIVAAADSLRALMRTESAAAPETIRILQPIADAGKTDAGVYRALGDAYMRTGRFQKAIEQYNKAVAVQQPSAEKAA